MKKTILSLIAILGLFTLTSAQLQWTESDSVDYQKQISLMQHAATEKQSLEYFYAASVIMQRATSSSLAEFTNAGVLLLFFDDIDSISKAKYRIGINQVSDLDPGTYPHKVWVDGIRRNMEWVIEQLAIKALDQDQSLWYELDNRDIGTYSPFVSHLARNQVDFFSKN